MWGVVAWRGCDLWELRFVGVAICGNSSWWELLCNRVAMLGSCSVWDLQYVGVAVCRGCVVWELQFVSTHFFCVFGAFNVLRIFQKKIFFIKNSL